MTIFLTIIAVIVIFSVLVLVHEYGHFATARKAGIKVLEFGFGFPPRLWSKKKGETLYTINAIPFGGFVKLYGEDNSDPKVIKDPKSFASQSKWVRTKVIVAGVFMNFALAILLLTIGFIFGIQPLLVNENDLYANIETGIVETSPGIYVGDVSESVEKLGVKVGDKILAINDAPITDLSQIRQLQSKGATKDVDLTLAHEKNAGTYKVHLPLINKNELGISLKSFATIPRLKIAGIKEAGLGASAGFKVGDTVLTVNGTQVYSQSDWAELTSQSEKVTVKVLRGDATLDIQYQQNFEGRVVIAQVLPESPAKNFGFQDGDRIISISGQRVATAQDVQKLVAEANGQEKDYSLVRNSQIISIKAKIEPKTKLGIALSEVTFFNRDDFSFYPNGTITSLVHINNVRLGPWSAFKQAISESVRLTGVTINAFGNTIRSIVGKMSVPNDIGGPVQIAYYTHTFVQEGFFALLRFTALLSLSLAVMNILPIPALDGGRLLFIIIEAITGRRVSARFEALVHGIGFILLMGLILLITYSDIVKLF